MLGATIGLTGVLAFASSAGATAPAYYASKTFDPGNIQINGDTNDNIYGCKEAWSETTGKTAPSDLAGYAQVDSASWSQDNLSVTVNGGNKGTITWSDGTGYPLQVLGVAVKAGNAFTFYAYEGSVTGDTLSAAVGNNGLSHYQLCAVPGTPPPNPHVTVSKSWSGVSGLEGYSAQVVIKANDEEVARFTSPTVASTVVEVPYGADVTVSEQNVSLPVGCTNESNAPQSASNVTQDTSITVTNSVSCTVDVTVTKDWSLQGEGTSGVSAGITIRSGETIVATMPVVSPSEPSTTVTVPRGSTVTISETALSNVGDNCSATGLDDPIVLSNLQASTTVTVHNSVSCEEIERFVTVTVNKDWVLSGPGTGGVSGTITIARDFGEGKQTLTTMPVTSPTEPSTSVEVPVGATVVVSESALSGGAGCTVGGLTTPIRLENLQASTTVTVTNTVSCPPIIPPPPIELPQTPEYDLGITKATAAANLKPGDSLSYTITVTASVTSGSMTNVVVTDEVPAQLTNPKITGPAGWTCSVTGQKVQCTKPTFAFDEKAVFTLTATVAQGVPGGTVIKNVATVKADQTEVTLSNNVSSANVSTVADLPIELPRTGGSLRLAGVAMALVGGGLLLLALGRRRVTTS